jgi:hypothetical protein
MHTEPKRKVTLVFPTVIKLWEFAETLDKHEVEIDSKYRTLRCDCKIPDIDRAIKCYGAREHIKIEITHNG